MGPSGEARFLRCDDDAAANAYLSQTPLDQLSAPVYFYGFVFYLLVNLVDALDGYVRINFVPGGFAGHAYTLVADVLSALVLFAVVALVARRFLLPSRRDFNFNERTLLHEDVRTQYITRDSLIVSGFILFHVGSRAVGSAARVVLEGQDRFAPFASVLSHLVPAAHAEAWAIFGYWGALGSVLAFLGYFPYSKHVHIFAAPAKYLVARHVESGVLPTVALDAEGEEPKLGAAKLEDLAWPRLLDAYACIQCNRCQDVCPATATGKSLSPSALEINKRMELNRLGRQQPGFERGEASPNTLLSVVLSAEAAWACTTCGACMQVCPVQDEPMLDIIDIRRQQVMVEGEFPMQLQSAFRGMERAKNPWGTSPEKRLDWADGLNVKTTEENPKPEVLFWVGCAASYDPQSQKTARAFVQLLQHAEVDFAVLGKRECCTGDSARRAGNEYLFKQLADTNVETLNAVQPKLIVATCPHCLNAVGKEYRQFGGDYKVMHHTEYLASLVADGKLSPQAGTATVAFHDPCYLGRHHGVYDAPRNLLNILSNSVVELDRNRENSFCCGAGGAQFWKEEEPGEERISDNRYREAHRVLGGAKDAVLAVGCPFCKSMLESTPAKGDDGIRIRDVAELLLEAVEVKQESIGTQHHPAPGPSEETAADLVAPEAVEADSGFLVSPAQLEESADAPTSTPEARETVPLAPATGRRKWTPRRSEPLQASEGSHGGPADSAAEVVTSSEGAGSGTDAKDLGRGGLAAPPARKVWQPKLTATAPRDADTVLPLAGPAETGPESTVAEPAPVSARKLWRPKMDAGANQTEQPARALPAEEAEAASSEPAGRKKWTPKRKPDGA